MQNLIDIKRLTVSEINSIINRAVEYKSETAESIRGEISYNSGIIDFAKFGERLYRANSCFGKTACMMFFENSTRTKCSFSMAAQKLGMNIIDFDTKTSSFSKGESLKDTIENLCYIGVNTFVIRHSEDNIVDKIAEETDCSVSFINAGDGKNAHPTQALLDYMTMLEKLGTVVGKKVTILGDIAHSRVAKSNIALLNKMKAEVHLFAPEYFVPENKADYDGVWESDYDSAIKDADVVMLLRVQNERLNSEELNSSRAYKDMYSLTSDRLEKYAPNAIIMHPGPVNRDVEISSELLDSKKGKTILEQARNGVYVRMAVLENGVK